MNKLLVIVGATAVGKTRLSLAIAQRFDGEIVSADSRLFYRGMDIGTAKPTPEEQALVPHHLIDICEPDQTLTLGTYQAMAYGVIDLVLTNGRLPILVGGTGQYVKAVIEGWGIPEVAPQPALRAVLEQIEVSELARWLQLLDPNAAERLDLNNGRRLVRALEVTLVSGIPISTLQTKTPPPYDICMLGLQRERSRLYARIDLRVDNMMTAGLLAEVKGLLAAGYGSRTPAMTGLGYRQLLTHLNGEMTLDTAIERVKFETHRFARQQNNWFHRSDENITWFDMDVAGVETAVVTFVHNWLNNGQP